MEPIAAGILSTGTEILQGHYADTNAQWLSEKLTALGIQVTRHVAAPDEAPDIAAALRYLASECDLVIMTGGLGPTEDDLTRQAICDVFGVELVEDAKAWKMIQERFVIRKTTTPPSNRVQAMIPKGAAIFYNKWGTAPGFSLECPYADKKTPLFFAALPGPPPENRPMFEEYLEEKLADKFGGGLLTRITNLHTFGVSESALNDKLRPLFAKNTPNHVLALLASNAKVDIRFTLRARDKNTLAKETKSFTKEILKRVPRGCMYGRDEDTLENVVFNLLLQANKRIAFAESCTGGYIAKRITDIPGSSQVFLESWVNYSNEAKRKRLGVRATTLSRHGAVSLETAREMALGALARSDADLALSVTGIAGPGGGTPEKPLGLVWYGLAWKSESGHDAPHVETFKTITPFGRDLTRQFAAHRALDLVRRHLMGLPLEL